MAPKPRPNALVRFARPGEIRTLRGFDVKVAARVIKEKAKRREIIVVLRSGKIAGYLRLEFMWSKLPFIGLIAVDASLRKRGLGTRLLHFCENYLRRKGYRLFLSSSQSNEPDAQAWHRKHGFRRTGMLRGVNDDGSGEIFFLKNLD